MIDLDIPKCPVYKKCSGCQLQNLSYSQQLDHKQAMSIGILGDYCHVSPITGMYYPLHYRNKISAVFAENRGKAVCGVWQSSSKKIVQNDGCMIEDKISSEIIKDICDIVNQLDIPAFNRYSWTGFLRHVLVRRGFKTGQVLVSIVSANPIFPKRNIFISKLLEKHPEITTIVHGVSSISTELVQPSHETVLFGKGYIEDKLLGLTFRITASSFYQINPVQTEKLYTKAVSLAKLTGKETVLDAYCGVGTIGLCAAKKAGQVIGVESNGAAVKNAISNAKINGIKNTRFYKADATSFIEEMATSGEHCDVIFMDPPRAGSTPEFIRAAASLSPDKIVYISCNIETQARDINEFLKYGYCPTEAHPFDMFPFTNHVESVVLLTR